MDFFVEPVQGVEEIILPESVRWKETAEDLAVLYGINLKWASNEKKIEDASDLFIHFANRLAWQRERSGESLRKMNPFSQQFRGIDFTYFKKSISILGSGLMVEAIAKHFSVLEWTVRAISASENENADFEPGECFIFTKEALVDKHILLNVFEQKPAYIGLIDSYQNAKKVVDSLEIPLFQLKELPLFIPAGIDIGARNPYEVGLSVATEIIKEQREMH